MDFEPIITDHGEGIDVNLSAARATVHVPGGVAAPGLTLAECGEILGVSPSAVLAGAKAMGVPFDEQRPEFTPQELKAMAVPVLRNNPAARPLWRVLERIK
ncbi:MAG TPA: hypothetical protein VGI81_19840 [Tepidisphaeraceae bacterium]|jgi:hypothetical protein